MKGEVPEASVLLQHAAFLRRVVRGILADEQAVDDVVQGALLSALERPPRGTNLRAWLARVARNLAISRWRSERSRHRRERAVARPEAQGAPDDTVPRLETQRRVVDAVAALREPYRSTVVERYFDGRTPKEIAARHGLPPQTVRTRLKRALAQLRARLREPHGDDRHAFLAALAPLLQWRSGTATGAALAAGGFAMNVKALGAAALVLLGLLLVWTVEPGATSRTDRSGAEDAPAPVREAGVDPKAGRDPLSKDAVTCSGVVVDALGAGTAARVVARPAVVHDPAAFWAGDAPAPAKPVAVADAGDRGVFRIRLLRGRRLVLRAVAANLISDPVPVALRANASGVVLRLQPAGELAGIVVDEKDRPVRGARVRAVDVSRDPSPLDRRTSTDGEGAFALAGLPCGTVGLLVAHPAFAGVFESDAAVPRTGLRIRLRRGREVSGVVRTAEGRPAPDVRVALVPVERLAPSVTTVTDTEGRFRCARVAPYPLHAIANGGEFGSAQLSPAEVGTRDTIEIRLDPVRTVHGRVVDADGAGVEGVRLRVHEFAFFHEPRVFLRHYYRGVQSVVSGEGGAFVVRGVWLRHATVLVADQPGWGTASHFPIPPEGGEVRVLVFARCEVRGVVRDPDGRPVAGARVEPRLAGGPPALSGADGRFVLPGVVYRGPFASVRASKHGYAPGESLRFDPREDVEVEVALRRAVAVRGRVIDEEGAAVPRARVGPAARLGPSTFTDSRGAFLLHLKEGEDELIASHPDYRSAAARIEAGMTLTLSRAPPRAWLRGRVANGSGEPIAGAAIFVSPPSVRAMTDVDGRYEILDLRTRRASVTVGAAGHRTEHVKALELPAERDFVLRPGLAIEGRLVDHRGEAVAGANVNAGPAVAMPGADGRFRLEPLAPGAYTVRASFPRGPWRPTVERDGVAAGATDVELRLPEPGFVAGRVLDHRGRPVAGVEVFAVSAAKPLQVESGWTLADGRFRIGGLYHEGFRVQANLNRRLHERTTRTLSAGWASRPVLDVAVGATDVVIRAEDGPEVSGVVLDTKGEPASETTVSLKPLDDAKAPRGVVATDAQGRFVLRGLAPGQHELKAWAKDGSRTELEVRAGTAGLRIELDHPR